MMYEVIKNFNKQFEYEPKIENAEALEKLLRTKNSGSGRKWPSGFIIAGMGGSNLVADLLRIRDPYINILIHRNYGLPSISDEELKERLFIASSYSGNTEETVDSLASAIEKKLPAAVVSTGGRLIELAKEHGLPYIQVPATGIQPRSATGFNIKAVVKLTGREDLLKELTELAALLNPGDFEKAGEALAKKLKGRAPVIYSSAENIGVAYNWKIKFNETGKIPAFYNVLSELNHNEMTGFDVKDGNRELARTFHFIILKDSGDHPRVQKRMEILERLYRDRGLPVETIALQGLSAFHKIFSSLVLADWAAYYTAIQYGLESEQVPMVEEFKRFIE